MQSDEQQCDIYLFVIEVQRRAGLIAGFQHRFGNLVWNYWKALSRVETSRIKVIPGLLNEYFKQQMLVSGSTSIDNLQRDSDSMFSAKYLMAMLNVEQLFTSEEKQEVVKNQKTACFAISELQNFIQSCNFPLLESIPL